MAANITYVARVHIRKPLSVLHMTQHMELKENIFQYMKRESSIL